MVTVHDMWNFQVYLSLWYMLLAGYLVNDCLLCFCRVLRVILLCFFNLGISYVLHLRLVSS